MSVNGSTRLDWVEVAKVLGREEGHAFQYLPGESDDTVWPGMIIGLLNGLSNYDLL